MTNTESTPFGTVGQGAGDIATSIERAIDSGQLGDGTRLPAVRELADELAVAPGTVAAAYRILRSRGLVSTSRRGTLVTGARTVIRPSVSVPEGVRDLSDGNPDPALLPPLPLDQISAEHVLYRDAGDDPALLDLAAESLRADGITNEHLAVVGGAHDGVERVLAAHLRPGDRVGVEDPGYTETFDLLRSMGLDLVPVGVDEQGPVPDALEGAIDRGIDALIVTPRAQNPIGAALSRSRARRLAGVLEAKPSLLVIEDDHAGPVAGAPMRSLAGNRERWATIRSVSKYLGPDLRTAVVAGDDVTVSRVRARQAMGTGWVSGVLQRLTAHMLGSSQCREALAHAEDQYRSRRDAMHSALADRGIESIGVSGLNVWIPVVEETSTIQHLLQRGFALQAGEAFRLDSPPAVRVTTARMAEEEAEPIADALAEVLQGRSRHRV